jgi:hypothetical protein
LEAEVLPGIDSWFDPEGMAPTLENRPPGTFPGLPPIRGPLPWHCWMWKARTRG